jgi:8-oxo-dGTP pyrophosphatase MutT (NUDIX family)
MKKRHSTIPVRPTARVLLLDRADRILLMKGRLPGSLQGDGAWFTIGGGVEAGETWLEAAAREIIEETGITAFELGPIVWAREGVLEIPDPVVFDERYVVARCDGAEPSRDGWNAVENELIDDIAWWTLPDLRATAERVFPPGLAQHLPPILAGTYPPKPLVIPWG